MSSCSSRISTYPCVGAAKTLVLRKRQDRTLANATTGVTATKRNRAGVMLASSGGASRSSRDLQMVCSVLDGPPAPRQVHHRCSLSIPTERQLSRHRRQISGSPWDGLSLRYPSIAFDRDDGFRKLNPSTGCAVLRTNRHCRPVAGAVRHPVANGAGTQEFDDAARQK
jgi:hypothetical protein